MNTAGANRQSLADKVRKWAGYVDEDYQNTRPNNWLTSLLNINDTAGNALKHMAMLSVFLGLLYSKPKNTLSIAMCFKALPAVSLILSKLVSQLFGLVF